MRSMAAMVDEITRRVLAALQPEEPDDAFRSPPAPRSP